jgi:hypothetical protein
MFTQCTHSHQSGSTCKSPAVRGTNLCFHHTPHQNLPRRRPAEYEPFELPPLKNKGAVLVAISEVLYRLSMRRIKRSEADTLIHGLGKVSRLMTEIDQSPDPGQFEYDQTQSAPSPESDTDSDAIQHTLDDIANQLGIEMPSFEEMQQLQATMPNGTPEKALDHWISTGRIRLLHPAPSIPERREQTPSSR